MVNPTDLAAAATTPDEAPTDDAGPTTPLRFVDPRATTLEDAGYVSRYRLGERLGQGGMGEVRLCRDRRVGRDVAMKVIHPEQRGRDDLRARFLREARVQGQLEHPSIVPVYDLGLAEEGATYFTMKRVRGLGLDAVLGKLRSEEPEALARFTRHRLLTAFTTVCNAVHYAHHRGVIHRDLKPANIMLGDFGEVYVLDWGVARLVEADGDAQPAVESPVRVEAEPTKHTALGTVIGTPGYMAPEQLQGHPASVASDVYALGAILFELLALDTLHPRVSSAQLVASTLGGPEARAAVRAPERDLPPELEAIWLRATHLEPSSRYPDARALCDAVERFLEGDRDLSRRRAMAREHASQAEALASRALSSQREEDRRSAVREAGRALALDPSEGGALGTLLKLLLEPPKTLPEEVRLRVLEDKTAGMATAARAGAINYLAWASFVLLCITLGVRDPLRAWTCAGLFLLSSWLCWRASVTRAFPPWKVPLMAAVSTTAIGFLASFFGPLILLPAALVANCAAYTLAANVRFNVLFLWVCACLLALLFVGPYFHLLPPSYTFESDLIRVSPRTVSFDPRWTPVLLGGTHVVLLLLAGRVFGRLGARLRVSTERIHLLAWHLQQIVPDASPSTPSLPPTRVNS
ncbi:MAG: serine/threonine protein kinase [Deltaproteobacteria bacterium]|nr:serine/threonine protein kinase [Deltaproteobacteria bacterium]